MATVITGLDGEDAGRPVPVVSALAEFGSALHVLRDPGHHDATGWALEIRAAISPRLESWTRAWWWTTQAIRATPFVTGGAATENYLDSLARLRAVPASRLAAQLLRPISPSGDARAAIHWSRSRGPSVAAVVHTLVTSPDRAAADFLEFLDASWREWFSVEWDKTRPVLAARARVFADTVSVHGAAAALAAIDPAVTVTAPGSVSIAKVRNSRHDVSRRGLLVAASTRIRPHLYVGDVRGQPLFLIYPADAGSAVPSAAELLRRLGVMAHSGRLEVARAIATEPRTAGEISQLWGIDPTLVNRHLRALAAAGLARTIRQGRFVQYQLDADCVAALGGDLLALLLR